MKPTYSEPSGYFTPEMKAILKKHEKQEKKSEKKPTSKAGKK